MSDQEKNTGRTDDMNFSVLDEELARMAEETPEVPADFHDNWTRKIREEAAAGEPETEAGKPRKGRGQLRYILSAAAAFVILVGGVVIARNNGLLQERTSAPETPVLAANTLTEGNTQEAAEAADEAAEAPSGQMLLMGISADAMPEPAPEAGMLSEETADISAARKAEAAEAAPESEAEAPILMATANPTALPEPTAASGITDTGSGGENAATEPETADPAAGEAEAEEATAEEAAAEEAEDSAADPGPEQEEENRTEDSHSFLQKVWEGLLNAVPWILGGAIIVLFILTRVIRPESKRK